MPLNHLKLVEIETGRPPARHRKAILRKRRRQAQANARYNAISDQEYIDKRKADFQYYLNRSDLNGTQIADSLGINQDWFKSVSINRIQKPNQYRITLIIDFIKDFERLQTYYAAFLK